MTTSTERDRLVRAAELALAVAGDELPAYSCPKSPRRFTQPQLLACLVLRAYRKQAYRGVTDVLGASDDLRRALGLTRFRTTRRCNGSPTGRSPRTWWTGCWGGWSSGSVRWWRR